MESDILIKTVDLSRHYKVGEEEVIALDKVNLEIERNKICAILGTSGSGKSTLLNMLAGIERPSGGEVYIGKYRIDNLSEADLAKFRQKFTGFIFQSYNLMPTMTALENVALPLMFKGVGKEEREAKAMEMLKLVGIDNRYTHKPKEMSGGQQQRVGIARAFVTDPSVVFADEPTGNLDSKTTIEVMDLIKQLVYTKKQTLVMVTHDANVAKYSDITVNISDGFSIDKKAIYAGDTFKLKYKIKNTNSKLDVKNLNMRLSGGDTFTVANDVDTIYSPSLSKGASAQFSKNFYVSAGASAGMYPITISATYEYTEDGETTSGTAEFSYTVQVLQGTTHSAGSSPSLVASFGVSKANLTAGDNFKLNFKLSNKSAQYNVNNVNIKLAGGDAFSIASDVDTIYKSKINKASSANFSKQFICNKGIPGGRYPITASVTYEYVVNGEKQQGTAEFTFSIKVISKKRSKKASELTPQLIVSSFSYGKESVSGGKEFTLSFNIKNNSSSIKAQNVLIKLAGGDSFVVADGTDTISIKSIKPNATVKVSKKFNCLSTATSGVYPITATVSYEYIEGGKQSGSSDLTMSIPVVQPDKVQFQQIALADKTINVSEENDCAFQVINMGQTKLSNGTVKLLNEKGKEINSAYIGNIDAGGQFVSNYTLPVTFDETGDYKLTLVFEYENENMDKKSIEQEFKVTVQKEEDPFDKTGENPEDNGKDEEDHSNTKKVILGSVIGGVALIAVIVSTIVIKKKKHKKGSVKFDEKI